MALSLLQNNLPEAELVFKQALGILGRNPQVPGVQMAMAAGLNNLSIAQMQQVSGRHNVNFEPIALQLLVQFNI